jgi:diguanylate cyclase (GGDEF)-like protein
MKISKSTSVRVCIAVSSMLVYAVIFLATYPYLGLNAAAFNAIPAAVFGGLLGIRGGFLYLLIALPTNILIFNIFQSPYNELITHFLGISTFTLISIGIGWVRDMRDQTDRIGKQKIELEAERMMLQEEILRRTDLEERLAYEALHDPLTDLPNRRFFFNRLEHAYAWSERNPNSLSAVLYLDLNKFKTINDSMGHEAGDQLLKQVADRLKASVRLIDTVARVGGDEFAILLEAATSPEDVNTIIQRILVNLALPYELNGRTMVNGVSIGIVMNIRSYKQLDHILRDADRAMYQAKISGENQYRMFDAEL